MVIKGGALDHLGSALSTAGNFDDQSSSISEFVIGADGDGDFAARIYSGADSNALGLPKDGAGLDVLTVVTAAGDGGGSKVLGGFDFNGDGISDVAVVAPNADNGAGAVYVVYGNTARLSGQITLDDLGSGMTKLSGNGVTGFGADIAALDIDNDGFDDLVVGAPSSDAPATVGAGSAFVFSGAANAKSQANLTANHVVHGVHEGGSFGGSLTVLDFNGDGRDDLAIGAPGVDLGEGFDQGVAYVVFGANGANPLSTLDLTAIAPATGFKVEGTANGEGLGTKLATIGNANAAAGADLMALSAGAQGAGQLTVIQSPSGRASRDPGNVDVKDIVSIGSVTDNARGAALDYAVVGAFAATANGNTAGHGVVDIVLADGGAGYRIVTGQDAGSNPLTVGSLGDINADGIDDIAIGVQGQGAFVLLGGRQNIDALDLADGTQDRVISASAFFADTRPDVAFVSTNTGVTITGTRTGTVDLATGITSVEGTIAITDVSAPGVKFDATDPEGSGTYGTITVTPGATPADAERWRYDLNAGSAAALAFLGAGETVVDTVLLTASNGSQSAVAVTLRGVDDPTQVEITTKAGTSDFIAVNENVASFSGQIKTVDKDQNDTPDISGKSVTVDGFGTLAISDDGTSFTFTADPAAVDRFDQLNDGQQEARTFTFAAAGIDVDIQVRVQGSTDGATAQAVSIADTEGAVRLGSGNEAVTLTGTSGATVDTGAGNDSVTDSAGGDVISDPFGNDSVTTGAGNDRVQLWSGSNTITETGTAANESNYLAGGIGRDVITGGAGRDILDGDSLGPFMGAADRLEGGAGNDIISGGVGADVFVFRPNHDDDTIADFDAVVGDKAAGFQATTLHRDFDPGIDTVALLGFGAGVQADVMSQISDTASGYARFDAEGTTIVFFGVATADLSADDFVFTLV